MWKEFDRPGVTTAMAKDQDDEDYIVYGTPLEREEELGPRKRKEALDQGQARRVAPWNQEVSQFFDRAMQEGHKNSKKISSFFLCNCSSRSWMDGSEKDARGIPCVCRSRILKAVDDFMVLSVVVSQQGTLTLLAPKKVCLFLHSFCIRCRKFFG